MNWPNSLWGILWCGLCHGASKVVEGKRKHCDERWALKGRTIWIVKHKGSDEMDLRTCPGQAQKRVWELEDRGIEAHSPFPKVIE